jgi:hypothetical protein
MTDGEAPISSAQPALAADAPNPPETPEAASAWLPPLLVGFGYLLFWQIAPRIRSDALGAMLVSTVIGLSLIIWFTALFARSFRTPAALGINFLLSAAVIIPFQVMIVTGRPLPPWTWLMAIPGLPHLLLVWLAASLGALLSFLLRGANMIPPIAAVLALVDIWTVLLGGPVQKIMQSQNPTAKAITRAMTVQLPRPRPTGASPIPANLVVGFADFLFIAFFVAAISRFVSGRRVYSKMLWTLVVVLSLYMLIVFIYGSNLPALLPLSVVMIALNWRHFHYDRSEAFALLYAALFIVLIAGGFWYFGNRKVAPTPEELERDKPRAGLPVRLQSNALCRNASCCVVVKSLTV